MLAKRGISDHEQRSLSSRRAMEKAFPEALVDDYSAYERCIDEWPDLNDRHVVAAAIKIKASVIVTDNLKDFPVDRLAEFELSALAADAFIAGSIDLKPAIAVEAVKTMRARLARPEMTAEMLLLKMEQQDLVETAGMLADKTALFCPQTAGFTK